MYKRTRRTTAAALAISSTDDVPRTRSTNDAADGVEPSGVGSPKSEKLRMRAWLIRQVDSGRIAGLTWHDQSRRLIRIPWIHGSRKTWNADKHNELFRAWAEYRGRYDPKETNPKRWKANFRCALNSLPDVVEVDHLKKKGQNAYKIYELKTEHSERSKNTMKSETKHSNVSRQRSVRTEKQAENVTPSTNIPDEKHRTSPSWIQKDANDNTILDQSTSTSGESCLRVTDNDPVDPFITSAKVITSGDVTASEDVIMSPDVASSPDKETPKRESFSDDEYESVMQQILTEKEEILQNLARVVCQTNSEWNITIA